MEDVQLVANAAFGLEAIAYRELRTLGYEDISVEDGRLRFRAPLSAVCRTNIWLRSAERVQIVVGDFRARDFDELFDQTKELPWEQWLGADAAFPVSARSVRSTIRSVPNVQKMVKRAIVERMRKVYSRHWFAETGPTYEIEASLLRDQVLLTIDTTGTGLHKRGYRRFVGEAPLRESLAAGIILLSYWNRDRQLADPFCGTGTIAIEAAMIGRNMAPGRNRDFAAEKWPQIANSLWSEVRREARDAVLGPLPVPILASDVDPKALKLTKQHAEAAGVASDIHLMRRPFIEFNASRDYGCVITNPPYGERMGSSDEVSRLHHEMGEILTMYDTWSHYVLTAAPRFEREFGRRADRRRKLFNGRIECTLYQYLGPRPPWEQPLPAQPGESDAAPPPETEDARDATGPSSAESAGGSSSVDREERAEGPVDRPPHLRAKSTGDAGDAPENAGDPPSPESEIERRMAARRRETGEGE